MRDSLKENLKSTFIKIFNILSAYLKNTLKYWKKNKEISEEKETINELEVKINALEKIL